MTKMYMQSFWRTSPILHEDAFTENVSCLVGQMHNTGMDENSCFSWLNTFFLDVTHYRWFFLNSRSLSGLSFSAKQWKHFHSWLTIPRKLQTSITLNSYLIFRAALIFSVLVLTLLVDRKWPKNVILLLLNTHLSMFSMIPAFLILFNTVCSLSTCHDCVPPSEKTITHMANFTWSSSRTTDIHFWKNPGAEAIPEHNLLKK